MPSGTPVPITKGQAIAYARAVNLRGSDVPALASFSPEGAAPAPTPGALQFARCYGGASPARRIAKVHSPEFGLQGGPATKAQFEESRVEVWPTPELAAGNHAANLSPRGRACIVRFLEARNHKLDEQRAGSLQHGRPTVTVVADPLPGVGASSLLTITEPLLRGDRTRVRIYHDIFTFIAGAAEVELEATGFSHPVPVATEERLLLLLVSRAKATAPAGRLGSRS